MKRISIENARGKIRICFETPFTGKKLRGGPYKSWAEAIQAC
jgi:hypothetical protein